MPTKQPKVTLLTFVALTLSIVASSFGVEFYLNTKDGMGFAGQFDAIQYELGYPFARLKVSFDTLSFLKFELSGGYDFVARTFLNRLTVGFVFNQIEVGVPMTFKFRQLVTDEATEVGRLDVGLAFAWLPNAFAKSADRFAEGLELAFVTQYSPAYLYYDPAFDVNIVGFRTESLFRASVEIKATYYTPLIAVGLGYSALFRWLPYRATFITSEDNFFFETRFKVKF